MEVGLPVPEFHFNTATNTPYIISPSSPANHFTDDSSLFEFRRRHHVSAPNSPTFSAAIYAAIRASRHSTVPFEWESKPGTPKSSSFDQKEDDFVFDFSYGFIDKTPLSSPEKAASLVAADELFELGKIRPLKLPPRLCSPVIGEQGAKSPRSGGFWSPLHRGRNQRGKEVDPFVLAMVEATRSRRGSRSLSPFGGRGKGGSVVTPASSPPRDRNGVVEKGGRGWMYRLKGLFTFGSSYRSSPSPSTSSSPSSSSSSSSSSSNSSVKEKTVFGVGESRCSSFRSEESGSTKRGALVLPGMESGEMEKKMVVPCKRGVLSVPSFTGGKFGASFFFRRRS